MFAMQVALAADHEGPTECARARSSGTPSGEAAAAVVAGALSLEDGVRVICRRSRLMSRIAGSGAMASVELPAQQVLSELMARGVNDVVVAVVASPQSTVIGGATETVRELVAAWEQRDVMAREVAVDVASHSPQVDPILDELSEALADLRPMTPRGSVLLGDPVRPARAAGVRRRLLGGQPACTSVRFAAAVQAALDDGYRVFAELAPHPLLTHAVEQTAGSLDMPVAALAGMRREQPLPHGLRGLLADLHSAGAAVDFSVLYPGGRLVDAPLPAWTHRSCSCSATAGISRAQGASIPLPCIRCWARMCGCPRSRSATSGRREVGTAALPWLGDHQVHNVAALPGAAYCEMALAAARHGRSARRPRSATSASSRCCCSTTRPRCRAVASVTSPGVVDVRGGDRPGWLTAVGGPARCCTLPTA